MQTEEGPRTIALNSKKSSNATGLPRNRGKRQTKIQRSSWLLFPALQETVVTVVFLELMKSANKLKTKKENIIVRILFLHNRHKKERSQGERHKKHRLQTIIM